MSEKQQEQNTVFVVIESWNRNTDSDGSPQIIIFSNIVAAREQLKERVDMDRKNGIHSSHNPEDPDDDWEITDEEDSFYAWSERANSWIMFEIVERIIRETAG